MLWLKALHLIFMVTWFAGLFYLPRLFVYHSISTDRISLERFQIMEHKLFWGIMTPGGILTLFFGSWLLALQGGEIAGWLQLKLVLIGLLVGYHFYCGKLLRDFRHNRNQHGHIFYRWLNEAPVLVLIGIILLAVLRPF